MGKKGVSRKVAKAQRVEIIIGDEWMIRMNIWDERGVS